MLKDLSSSWVIDENMEMLILVHFFPNAKPAPSITKAKVKCLSLTL